MSLHQQNQSKDVSPKANVSEASHAEEQQHAINSILHPEFWRPVPGQLAWNDDLEMEGEDEKI